MTSSCKRRNAGPCRCGEAPRGGGGKRGASIDGDETVVRVGPGVHREATLAIGSITKTMVATVLASLHPTEGLDLDTPVGDLLDVPANGDVTLRQLATHTSGLPRMAPDALDHQGFRREDPCAAYSAELALTALADVERSEALANDGGAAYSNDGYQLLGLALEAASGSDLPTLLRRRSARCGVQHRRCRPLGTTAAKPARDPWSSPHRTPGAQGSLPPPTPRRAQRCDRRRRPRRAAAGATGSATADGEQVSEEAPATPVAR